MPTACSVPDMNMRGWKNRPRTAPPAGIDRRAGRCPRTRRARSGAARAPRATRRRRRTASQLPDPFDPAAGGLMARPLPSTAAPGPRGRQPGRGSRRPGVVSDGPGGAPSPISQSMPSSDPDGSMAGRRTMGVGDADQPGHERDQSSATCERSLASALTSRIAASTSGLVGDEGVELERSHDLGVVLGAVAMPEPARPGRMTSLASVRFVKRNEHAQPT